MNWKQILTTHTKPASQAGEYIETKPIGDDLHDEMILDASNWDICAVGSFMQDIIHDWKSHPAVKQENALRGLRDVTGIQLHKYGINFFDFIKEGDFAGARKCYDDIESTVNQMSDNDIGALINIFYHGCEPCDCGECRECTAEHDNDE